MYYKVLQIECQSVTAQSVTDQDNHLQSRNDQFADIVKKMVEFHMGAWMYQSPDRDPHLLNEQPVRVPGLDPPTPQENSFFRKATETEQRVMVLSLQRATRSRKPKGADHGWIVSTC